MPDLRLVAPAIAAWAGAWLTVAAPDAGIPAWPAVTTVWAAAVATLVVLVVLQVRGARLAASARLGQAAPPEGRGSRGLRAAVRACAVGLVALAATGVVTTAAGVALEARSHSPLAEAASSGTTVGVVVELTGAPRAMSAPWFDGGDSGAAAGLPQRVEGRVIAVDGVGVASVPVTATIDVAPSKLQLGTTLSFDANAATMPAVEAAAFRLRVAGDVHVSAPPFWLAWSGALRTEFGEAAATLGGDGGALVPGLAIGDTSAVGDALDEAMKASSLSHLTAVSGANCAIVTAAAFALAAAAGLARGARVLVALVALVGFIVLVTPESSVVRAGAMAVVVLIALARGRPGGGVAALAVAVIVLLCVDPWYSRDYGFALSVCATAGLLLLAGPLARVMARVMPTPLAIVLGVPLAAQLACQPVLILLDPALALYGVPANLLAAPAAPVGTIAGLIGCLLLPLLPSVGFAFLQIAWMPAAWIALVAHAGAALPFGRLPWIPDAAGAVLLVACTAIALWLVFDRSPRPRLRAGAVALLLVAVAVPVGISVGAPTLGRALRPGSWDLAACDIGQGDAVLLRSGEATALIDTGPDPSALRRCLDFLSIDRIDLLVLTHWDADHAGGTSAVVGRVDTVIHGPLDAERSSRARDPLIAGGAELVEVTAGDRGVLGEARWRVLWPEPGAAPGNDASVVLDVETPHYRGVFLGDLGEGAQRRLLAAAPIGAVDVVKVAHHGSADQSEELYSQLSAPVGIIGVGAENGYGHPTDRLLELLERAGTAAVRTDRSGTALLTAGDAGFSLWTERAVDRVGARP
ncbi:ComEC/Rec2 family competence protein [Agromyces sp. SYSU K20354]|uniref:ComEC/Rec2 family competence protein n=1 Tax=Agromyces cavernae TaxID=2898659 RepID=UPI001E38B690|nr:ComEC/Rec2 family competence protein [Agromyces cavernae]MCD2441959.1 ComEC/Rec2 family competence protein [Agromyces cavernae]